MIPKDERGSAQWLGSSQKKGSELQNSGQLKPESIPPEILSELERKGISKDRLTKINLKKKPSLSDQAALVNAQMEQEAFSTVSVFKKVLSFTGILVYAYFLVVIFLFSLFSLWPIETVKWLGYSHSVSQDNSAGAENFTDAEFRILGVQSGPEEGLSNEPIFPQNILQPISRLSLDLTKILNPYAYKEMERVAILDPNDIFSIEKNTLVPDLPVNIPDTSLFRISDNNLVNNLNAEFLQGRQPGRNIGDIAIVGEEDTGMPGSSEFDLSSITGLNNTNLSGNTGISNNNLANPFIIVTTSDPIEGGGIVNLGSSVDISCPTCSALSPSGVIAGSYGDSSLIPSYTVDSQGRITSSSNIAIAGLSPSNFSSTNISQWSNDSLYITASSANILSNKTISAGSNTITELTTGNLSASAGILNAQLANSTITLNAGTGLSGGGLIALGGNVTFDLDDTTVSPGSYGSSTTVSTFTVDAQGRLTAASDTSIAGLTTLNLSPTAGILNTQLDNSEITVNTSGPLTGGGVIPLGGTLNLDCSTCLTGAGTLFTATASSGTDSDVTAGGVLTLEAGNNLSTTNDGLGTITFATSDNPVFTTVNGLSITNNGSNTLDIAAGETLQVNNSLFFAGIDGAVITFQETDTYVGRDTTDTLTNKIIAAGANTISGLTNANLSGTAGITNANLANSSINIVAGTNLTDGGSVSLGGSVTLNVTAAPSFTTINGLSLVAGSDGFSVTGGTTPRTLTVTGADITIGSTIQPTSAGSLMVQSNGANTLTFDTGGAASLGIGNTNASSLTIGRSGVTTTINGLTAVDDLTIGVGTTITRHLSGTNTFNAGTVSLGSCDDIGTVTVAGAAIGDTVVATPTPTAGGIETTLLSWNAFVSSSNTVTIRACSVATLGGQDPSNQTWRADVWQH